MTRIKPKEASTKERKTLRTETSGSKSPCDDGVLMSFEKHDPFLACVLSLYDSHLETRCQRSCVENYVSQCLGNSIDSGDPSDIQRHFTEWFDCDSDRVLKAETVPKAAFWLGSSATGGQWVSEQEAGPLVAQVVESNSPMLTKWKPEHVAKCSRQLSNCSRFSFRETREFAVDVVAAQYSCSPSVFIPGTQKAATTYL